MADVTITPLPNGPYLVKGSIRILDPEGNAFSVERQSVALCRCGASTTKPFCDGTHSRIGFQAATSGVRVADDQRQ